MQPDLFGAGPAGLVYRPEMIDAAEEAALAGRIAGLPLVPFAFHGFTGRRRIASFGWRYRFDGRGLEEAEPVPDWLMPLRERAAALAGLEPEALAQILVTEYAEGAEIGWHRDRDVFGVVVGVSLLAPARLRFRRRRGDGWERTELLAAPRSAYLLAGPARSEWEHSIPPMDRLRYSVTFRTLVRSPAPPPHPGRAAARSPRRS